MRPQDESRLIERYRQSVPARGFRSASLRNWSRATVGLLAAYPEAHRSGDPRPTLARSSKRSTAG